MKNLIKDSFQIIRDNRKAYIWTNIIFYGMIAIGAVIPLLLPYNKIQAHYNLLIFLRGPS